MEKSLIYLRKPLCAHFIYFLLNRKNNEIEKQIPTTTQFSKTESIIAMTSVHVLFFDMSELGSCFNLNFLNE